jgi:hypothetical protein
MRVPISLPLLLLLLAVCVQSTVIARPYQGYVLLFELTPDNEGNVIDCKLGRAMHYSPNEFEDRVDSHASAALLQNACATFSHWKIIEVSRNRQGEIQPVDAPWPCFIRDDAPDKIDCHPSGRERVPVD